MRPAAAAAAGAVLLALPLVHGVATSESRGSRAGRLLPDSDSEASLALARRERRVSGTMSLLWSPDGPFVPVGRPPMPIGVFVEDEPSDSLAFTTVVSSWVMVAMVFADKVPDTTFRTLAEGLRYAVADSMSLCRQSVHVSEMRASMTNFDVEPFSAIERRARKRMPRSFAQRASQRRARSGDDEGDEAREDLRMVSVNITQVKATYEVRIFPQMRSKPEEVERKVSHLQYFGEFSSFARAFDDALWSLNDTLADMVMVDDVGLPERQWVQRPVLSDVDRSNCLQERMLSDAREMHQYVMFTACILIIMTTCAGSAVFTLKQPSHVPSRLNPLVRPPYI